MAPFVPLFRNPHLQTIAGAYWPRPFDAARYPAVARYYRTEPDVEVLLYSQRPAGPGRGTLLLVHGLEGSADRGYMLSTAQAALEAGFVVHRMNIRSCGGTEDRCLTLYHAGLTSDLKFVLGELAQSDPAPLFACGFSLGGNQVLKLAGEWGAGARDVLAGVIGVSVPIDLAACAESLKQPRNWLYQKRFLTNMADRLERRCRMRADIFGPYLEAARRARDIYEFDDRVTAQFFGFGSADRYYGTQSSGRFLEAIAVPAMLVQAEDDPMIPFAVFEHPALRWNPNLQLVATEHGGHVGFLGRGPQRLWLDGVISGWMQKVGNKTAPNAV